MMTMLLAKVLLCLLIASPPVDECSSYVLVSEGGFADVICYGTCPAEVECVVEVLTGQHTGITIEFCRCESGQANYCAGAITTIPNPPGPPSVLLGCVSRGCDECVTGISYPTSGGTMYICDCLD